MSVSKYIKNDIGRLDGKTVAISGATGGIGNALCNFTAELGASLVLLDRNAEKSRALGERLKKAHPTLEVEYITLELEDIDSVRAAAGVLLEKGIDYLVLNAGAYSIPRHKCSTGFDNIFQINYVSTYCLARMLLPYIKERGGRIVAVGSIAHDYSESDMNDIDFITRNRASLCYGNAKRHLMFALSHGFAAQGSVSIAHPGISFTGITAHYPKLIFAIIKYPMKIIFMKPKKACLSILRALFEDCGENEWIGPALFGIWGFPKKQKLNSCSKDEADRICAEAEVIADKFC